MKVSVVEGIHPAGCTACGGTTTVRVKCKGDVCQVYTEAARDGGSGAPGSN